MIERSLNSIWMIFSHLSRSFSYSAQTNVETKKFSTLIIFFIPKSCHGWYFFSVIFAKEKSNWIKLFYCRINVVKGPMLYINIVIETSRVSHLFFPKLVLQFMRLFYRLSKNFDNLCKCNDSFIFSSILTSLYPSEF